ncbi:hypothetical protein [Pedobacter puniceum]|uniref:Uncharacterized protein n=1 Tax=Pedobacter puniceum TaxID=2666136 RepID=A0A7K0FJW1_9SPHI|nr:hypothetical protein [Pedobacter puniceum]MRX46246.1 hypothetical protein [Pedobacter puniceum]
MEEKQYSLIDWTYSAEDAAHMLSTLYNAKLEYHNRQSLINHEGQKSIPVEDQRRIKELEEALKNIRAQINIAKKKNVDLHIQSSISLNFIPK